MLMPLIFCLCYGTFNSYIAIHGLLFLAQNVGLVLIFFCLVWLMNSIFFVAFVSFNVVKYIGF